MFCGFHIAHLFSFYVCVCVCFVLVLCLLYLMLPVSLGCPFFIVPSVFSDVYLMFFIMRYVILSYISYLSFFMAKEKNRLNPLIKLQKSLKDCHMLILHLIHGFASGFNTRLTYGGN